MNHTFNLAQEPWVPVIRLDGSADELSLHDLLVQAHNLREVFDPSPAVTLALYRLAVAILHWIYGVETEDEWVGLWKRECFPPEPIIDYFRDSKHLFDLFNPERPFWQVPEFVLKERSPQMQLFVEAVSGNNPVLFDHSLDDEPHPVTPAQAARGLIVCQLLSLGMGQSGKPFIGGRQIVKSRLDRRDAPLARGASLVLQGDNLHKTLTLNLLTRRFRGGFFESGLGNPIWERDIDWTTDEAFKPGWVAHSLDYLEYLTVLSRWVRLIPKPDEHGKTVVRRLYLTQGVVVPKDFKDPFKRYLRNKREGWTPVSFRADRALWRDSAVWFEVSDVADTKNHPPEPLRQAQAWVLNGILDHSDTLHLRIMGLGTKPGKAAAVQFWRSETLAMPMTFLADETLVPKLSVALDWAENGAADLDKTVRRMIHQILAVEQGGGDKERVEKQIANLSPTRRYWPRLEEPFNRLIDTLPGDPEIAYVNWMEEIIRAMRDSFDATAGMLPRRARELQAIVAARGVLEGKITNLKSISLFNEENV